MCVVVSYNNGTVAQRVVPPAALRSTSGARISLASRSGIESYDAIVAVF